MNLLPVLICIFASACQATWGQAPEKGQSTQSRQPDFAATRARLRLNTIPVPSEPAEILGWPLKCDSEGNLYLGTDLDGVSGVHKLSAKGERTAVFLANAATPEVKVGSTTYFSISADGDFYQLVYTRNEIARYVFVYKTDGSFRTRVKLQPGFPWSPYQLAAFASGEILVSGLRYDKDLKSPLRWPFTGIFAPDGKLLTEINLEDDDSIREMAIAGDPKVALADHPDANRAIALGSADVAADGNVYLMRRVSPAIFYAISAGGAVRRFTVAPGKQDFVPSAVHVAGNRIAIVFRHPQTNEEIIQVVDLEGHETAAYDEPLEGGRPSLGMAFACYQANPDRFTFLTTTNDGTLALKIAAPE